MLLFLKRKTETTEAADMPEAADAPRELYEFIPCHSHYNADTLLTRNGELMQTIKIDCNTAGLNYESSGDGRTVRDHTREAISEAITSDRYALWFHTIRKRKAVHYGSRYDNPFAAYVHEQWRKKHHWKYQYYNEIYLTILHEGQSGALFDKSMMKNVFLPSLNRAYRNAYLDKAAQELNDVTSLILKKIGAHYRAERLSIVERTAPEAAAPAFYSQPMEFFGTLLNLKEEAFPVREVDIGKGIHTHALTFGFNALESRAATEERRYGAIVSLKQYREVTPEAADRLMQAPMEFIISQYFSFIPASRALKNYKAQKELFEISGDTYSLAASGLEEMLKADQGRNTDFGEMQTTVTVMSDEYRHLDENVRNVQEAFADMGIITVREDIKLEECFWAQLPGNFSFIRRRDAINTQRVGGFCRLNLFPSGHTQGNHWGDAVALVPTTVRSPYFFNFHYQDNGHTAIVDFNSFRDGTGKALVHFLLNSALKYNARTFMFDRQHAARLWFDKIRGHYHLLPLAAKKSDTKLLRLNPFTLEDNPRNRSFLLAWVTALIDPSYTTQEQEREMLSAALDEIYAAPPADRHLQTLATIVAARNPRMAQAFAPFLKGGKCDGLFNAGAETLDISQTLQAFDMDAAVKHQCAVPLLAYLLHRIILSLDGTPVVIVLKEAWDILEHAFFAPRLQSLLEMLKQNNVMIMAVTEHPDTCIGKSSFTAFMQHAATRLYIPDDVPLGYTDLLPDISAKDARLLASLDRQKGDFVIKQGHEVIALRVDFEAMDDIKAVMVGDVKTLIAAGGKFAGLPETYRYVEDNR